jgi:hypothetical protein
VARRIRKVENIHSPHWVSNQDLPACSIMPQPLRYRLAPAVIDVMTLTPLFEYCFQSSRPDYVLFLFLYLERNSSPSSVG